MKISEMLNVSIVLIALLIVFVKVSEAQEKIELQTVYSLSVNITKDNTAMLDRITAVNGTISTFPTTPKDYKIAVISYNNKKLFEKDFDVSFKILIEPVNYTQSPVDEVMRRMINLRVPYFSDAKYITISHKGSELLKIDLSKDFCNNNKKCDLGENQYNCPLDCKKTVKIPWTLIFIFTAALILMFIILLKMKKKKPSKLDYDSLKDKWRIS